MVQPILELRMHSAQLGLLSAESCNQKSPINLDKLTCALKKPKKQLKNQN
jgi:hypothetical protein